MTNPTARIAGGGIVVDVAAAHRPGRRTSPEAGLSAGEINALRRVGSGLANFLPSGQRMRLTALGLIATTGSGRLVLTQTGKEHLADRELALGVEGPGFAGRSSS